MATSIISGLKSNSAPPTIHASSPNINGLSHLPIPSENLFTSNLTASESSSLVLLCVKPNIAPKVLEELHPLYLATNPPPILSIVAGLSTSRLQSLLPPSAPVLRAMPNLGATSQASITALCAGEHATSDHVDMAKNVLTAVGQVVELDENLFGAFTAVGGAGIAYVFMMAEAMADAGVRHGLSRKDALKIAAQTVKGAGECLTSEDVHPAILRNRVESPGGVTIAGSYRLEQKGFRGIVEKAITEAFKKNEKMEGDNK